MTNLVEVDGTTKLHVLNRAPPLLLELGIITCLCRAKILPRTERSTHGAPNYQLRTLVDYNVPCLVAHLLEGEVPRIALRICGSKIKG